MEAPDFSPRTDLAPEQGAAWGGSSLRPERPSQGMGGTVVRHRGHRPAHFPAPGQHEMRLTRTISCRGHSPSEIVVAWRGTVLAKSCASMVHSCVQPEVLKSEGFMAREEGEQSSA